MTAARFFVEAESIDATYAWSNWAAFAAWLHYLHGSDNEARRRLDEAHSHWSWMSVEQRSVWHLTAASLTATTRPEVAASYLARFDAYTSCFKLRYPRGLGASTRSERLRQELGVSEAQVIREAQTIWGFQGRPRRCVIPPRQYRGSGKASPGVDFLVMSCFLRPTPVSVGELRAWARCSGRTLPWYYRVHAPDAADDEPARFVPHDIAAALVAWLGEGLPGSYGWQGLPTDLPWGVTPPTLHDPSDLRAQVLAWVGAAEPLEQILQVPMSATDKFRLCARLRSDGLAGLPAWVQTALDLAPPTAVPTSEIRDRDLRSIAFLAGLIDLSPDALWLYPQEPKVPRHRAGLEGLGGLGRLQPSDENHLLVPGRLAWADVAVWPGTVLNVSELDEEAPTWPPK